MDATKIMIIRHAEKPDTYNGIEYQGVDANGTENDKSLVTLGWERAGALGTLFAPPWGPKAPDLATPSKLYASDPESESDTDVSGSDDEPSQRPYETILSVSALLGLSIDTHHAKKHCKHMIDKALKHPGVVLISWQHQDIPLIGRHILKQTATPSGQFPLPSKWPGNRYDIVWVFDRPTGEGQISSFTQVPQLLLAGDEQSVISI